MLLLLSLLLGGLEDVDDDVDIKSDEAEEFVGVVFLHLLVSRDLCVANEGVWSVLDEEMEVGLVFASVPGSILILRDVVTFCLRTGVVLSLWTRARRGEGGEGILARFGIFGLKVALVGGSVGYMVMMLFYYGYRRFRWRLQSC